MASVIPLWLLRVLLLVVMSGACQVLGGTPSVALAWLGLFGAARAAPMPPASLTYADDPGLWRLYSVLLVVAVGQAVLGGPLASTVFLGAFAGTRVLALPDHPLLRVAAGLLAAARHGRRP